MTHEVAPPTRQTMTLHFFVVGTGVHYHGSPLRYGSCFPGLLLSYRVDATEALQAARHFVAGRPPKEHATESPPPHSPPPLSRPGRPSTEGDISRLLIRILKDECIKYDGPIPTERVRVHCITRKPILIEACRIRVTIVRLQT
jgi:hypothetical protein